MAISDRKQLILEASKEVFALKGFFGSSSKELAKAAKISEALLYKHFSSKESLFKATVEDAISAYKKIPSLPQTETNFLRQTAFAFLKPDEKTFRLLFFAYLELDQNYLKDFLAIFETKLKNFNKAALQRKHFKNIKHFEKLFLSSLIGLKLLYPNNATEFVDEFADILLNGLSV